MRARSAAGRPSTRLSRLSALLLVAFACGCGSPPTSPPTGAVGSPAITTAAEVSASTPASASVSGPPASPSGATNAPGSAPAATPRALPSGPLFTPPPEAPPLDDATCLAILDRASVESALGASIGPVVAQGVDPNLQLACEYPIAGEDGTFRLLFDAGDAQLAYDEAAAMAVAAGQEPVPVDGVGDQAFHAAATSAAPEQLTFRKGPVLVRLWNQTDHPAGLDAFATLAGLAAGAIHAEVPPAP